LIRAARYTALLPLLLAASAVGFGRAADAAPAVDPPAHLLSAVSATGYRVRVDFGEPILTAGEAHGVPLVEVALPGATTESPAGTPQLPVRIVHLRVPPGAEARARVTAGTARPLGAIRPPVPMPGLLTDARIAARVGASELRAWLAGPAYSDPAVAPLAVTRRVHAGGEPFLEVALRPVQWDARSGAATILESATIDVEWDRPVQPLEEDAAVPPAGPSLAPWRAAGPRYTPAARPGAPARAPSPGAAPAAAPIRVSPAHSWVRIGVRRPGLYLLSPAGLAAAGVPAGGIDPASFRLFRASPGDLPESVDVDLLPDGLHECAIVVTGEGDGAFDPADRVFFYATGSMGFGSDLRLGGGINYEESVRSGEEPLWLTWNAPDLPDPPRRMASRDAAPVSAVPVLDHVTHRVHLEENRHYKPDLFRNGLRWDRWFYALLTQGSTRRFPISLPGALPGGAGSFLARVWGFGTSKGIGPPGQYMYDHYLDIRWNRAPLASAQWDFTSARDLTASDFAVGARDTIDFAVPFLIDPTLDPEKNESRDDLSYLAWFEVAYPRRLEAVNDTLRFVAPDSVPSGRARYRITGITDTAAVWLLDHTDPDSTVILTGGSVGGAAAPFTLTVEDSVGPDHRPRYALLSRARAQAPASISRYAPAGAGGAYVIRDLLDTANGADYLIVAPPVLLAEAQALAAYRASRIQGLPAPRIAIATMDRIAAQFGGGLPDPAALRNLLVYARRYWTGSGPGPALPPTYLCLLGDATSDPRGFLGFGDPDHVPAPANNYSPSLLEQYISDDYYGYLDGPGDGLLDLAIGRIPAKTAAEARTVIDSKMPAFEGASDLDPWRIRAVLVADDSWQRDRPDPLQNEHVRQMERKDRQHLAFPVERSKVYLNDYAWADTTHQSKPAARDELIARINQGSWLVDYIGHGSETVIADEQVLRSTDVGRLTNAARPPIFAFISCTVGRFDELGLEGLGELLLKLPGGGTVASLAATKQVFPDPSTRLNDALVDGLFPLRPRADSLETLGLAWVRAKNATVGENTRKYVLLGDPALSIPFPRGRGAWEKAPLDSLLRGEVVTLAGRALYADSSFDSTATGTALVQVEGPAFRRTQYWRAFHGAPTGVPAEYEVPGPTLYRGVVPVAGGRFEARFVVPTDGRIVGRGGRLRALLSSAGGRGTGLAVDSIRIAQGAAGRVDVTPPTISLRYPSAADSSVQAGDRLTFVIEDSSGVDLMRLDNAHTIFVVLDELGAPLEITAGFAYEPGSYTRGAVDYTVPSLVEGPHVLEVHASDTYGNIAVQTFIVDVRASYLAGDPLSLSQVFNYPNPFEGGTYIHARLNRPARLQARVLTVAGRRVRELAAEGQAGENYVFWDGLDSTGEKVAIGVYLIQVIAEAPGGKRATAVGRALRKE
jgi:hypothetical protein